MKIHPVHAVLASLAIVLTAVLAEVLTPSELMARASEKVDLDREIPRQFGVWSPDPAARIITPTEQDPFAEPDAASSPLYTQEVTRAYVDKYGHRVMLLVAYGPVQNFRLKAHRPETCYTAAGFRLSAKIITEFAVGGDARPLKLARLTAQREARFEPISYWMRVGNDITTGVIDRQVVRLKYGLRGLIPDGALVRVSTIGLPLEVSYKVQDQFLHDLLGAITPQTVKFMTGNR
jgi:EpsI family protein